MPTFAIPSSEACDSNSDSGWNSKLGISSFQTAADLEIGAPTMENEI